MASSGDDKAPVGGRGAIFLIGINGTDGVAAPCYSPDTDGVYTDGG